ncbi:prophage regulatory protein [Paraburkholderia sp. GAS33]|uniref:helix-turn-helix transcriptional regulator n=1 Tax=Paraburkholderia sp. GAS33 TaxID=3035130 RepID=UPI003D2027B5
MPNPDNQKIKFLRRHEVEKMTGLSRSQIYALIEADEFPRQVQLSANSVAWLDTEIERWMDERIRLRDNHN